VTGVQTCALPIYEHQVAGPAVQVVANLIAMVWDNSRAVAKRTERIFWLGHAPVLTYSLAWKKLWLRSIPAGTHLQPIVNLTYVAFHEVVATSRLNSIEVGPSLPRRFAN